MPESLSPEQQQLRDAACNFAQSLDDNATAAAVRQASQQAGFFPMTQPKEFGGSAATAMQLCIVRDELAARRIPHMAAVFGQGPGVLAGVGEPLRSSHLNPLLAGEKRGAFAFTEPDDAPQPTHGRSGNGWLTINGQKSYVTGGADADFMNTLVQIDGQGPALVVIDTDTPGVILKRRFASLDGSHHAAFAFENAQVPLTNLIGEPGEGLPRAMRQIGDTRLAIAANCVGTCRWVLAYLEAHLHGKDRSGNARGNKEGVRLRFADLRIGAFAARSMLYRTARLADTGGNVVNEGIACKVFATETLQQVVDTAIQLVGGTALTDDHPLARLYREVRVLRLAEGANDVLRLNLARGRLELDKGVI